MVHHRSFLASASPPRHSVLTAQHLSHARRCAYGAVFAPWPAAERSDGSHPRGRRPTLAERRREQSRGAARYASLALACAVAALACVGPAAGQALLPPIHYVYDELNRLVAVVDRDNSAAAYVYDAVGNILAIERFDAADIPGPIGITFVAPGKGKPGTRVTIYGKGFGTSGAEVTVAFNGAAATVTSVSANRIATTVPSGATTGPITVSAPLGTATSPKAFRILGPITVDPPSVQIAPGGTRQFSALAHDGAPIAAFWEVDGMRGGNTAVGTISTTGVYTAPSGVGAAGNHTITALDKDDVSSIATATVSVLPPATATALARGVTVGVATLNLVNHAVTARASVRVGSAAPAIAAAANVSVALRTPASGFTAAALTSVTVAPAITSVVPAAGARGALSMLVTITGEGFIDATQLSVLRNNAPDASITVANLAVNGDGTRATAEVTIASGAPTGVRVLRIATPAGASPAVGTGGNLFTVQ